MATLSSHPEQEAGPSSSGEAACDVFLSHSGRQKDFAEHLYEELCRAYYKPFLDKHSLPPGSHFPSYIKVAALGCKIGVVVLSEDFLTAKWPMIELELLIFGKPEVLPLFYRLSPDDLKHDDNLARWRCEWGKIARDQRQADRWEDAVKKLGVTNGLVKKETGSEVAYIKKVVAAIFKLIPSRVLYNLDPICGHEELTEEISRQFDALADDPRRLNRPCMIGLYGVGGLGKTTLCKAMVNFYNSQYLGRSCLIEFPSDGNKSTMAQNCEVAIRKLTGAQDHVLKEINDFDQVVQLIKDHVTKHDVFVAIDNVGQNSEEETERLLDVGFTANSKILLTGRSEHRLRILLNKNAKHSYVGSLPTPKHEVACQIFRSYLKLGEVLPLPVRNEVETFVKRYNFDGNYHSLSLKAVGLSLKKRLTIGGVSVRDGGELSRLLKEAKYTSLKSVDDTIKLSYDELPGHSQQMFLDLVFWIPVDYGCMEHDFFEPRLYGGLIRDQRFHQGLKRAQAVLWLQFFFKEYSEAQINEMVDELAMAGVMEIDVDNPGEEGIHFHDLYYDLALKEAKKSPRFLRTTEKAMKAIEWESVERVNLIGAQTMNMRQWQWCPQLQLFAANGINFRSGINLKMMPSLRVLLLENVLLSGTCSQIINLKGLAQLEVLCLESIKFLRRLEGQSALQNLEIFGIRNCPDLGYVDGLQCSPRLKLLRIQECRALKTSPLPYLGGVSGLQSLILESGGHVKKVRGCCSGTLKDLCVGGGTLNKLVDRDGVTGLSEHKESSAEARACLCPALEVLVVHGDKALKEFPNLLSPSLKVLSVSKCGSLRRMPDPGGMPALQKLYLADNKSLQEMEGYFSPTLVSMNVQDCPALTMLPDLSAVTGLKTLFLRRNASLEEVRGSLSPTLQELEVGECKILKELPDLSGLTCLQTLRLHDNARLKKLRGCLSPTLQNLEVGRCGTLKELPDLGGLTCLQSLILEDNARLQELRGCLISHSLRDVVVIGCGALKKMLDLDGLTGLKRLVLIENASLEGEMGRLSSVAQEMLVVWDCPLLTRSNVLETTSFSSLVSYGCALVWTIITSARKQGQGYLLPKNLRHVKVEGDQETKSLSTGRFPNLTRLEVRKCGQLEVIEGLGELSMLKEVVISECPRLVDRNGELSALRGREGLELVIDGCPFLENSIPCLLP